MKRRMYKTLLVLTIVVMLVASLTGCGGTTPIASATPSAATPAASSESATTEATVEATVEATPEATPTPVELKKVELEVYMVGDPPKDLQIINDKLNELTLRDLNCTTKFNYTTWTDFTTKYNLLLSTGQPIDLIYTASWLDYPKLCRKGAFKELDELFPTYAPELYKFIDSGLVNQTKIDGKIYTMPATWKEYISNGFQYRADLQKKFDLPVPDSLENVEAYLAGVKKNMPAQVLTNETAASGPLPSSFSAYDILQFKYGWVHGSYYGVVADINSPEKTSLYWGSPDFITDMKMLKSWADQGFWSRSSLSAKNDPTSFPNGKAICVIAGQNPNKYGKDYEAVLQSNPDWEVGYIPYAVKNGVAIPAHATQNGYGVPNSSENPERAIMFYEKLVLDKEYNYLTSYGIAGTHYNITSDGYYEGIGDPTKTGFIREGMNGWAWRNPDTMLFPKSFDVVKKVFADLDVIAAKQKYPGINIGDGFAEDYTPYQSERAALGTVLTQYMAPLEAGLVKDVDASVKNLMDKLNAAGLEKIQTEYIKQWEAYCDEFGYNK